MKLSHVKYFTPLLTLCILGYLFIEWSYIQTLPLIMDEFQGGAQVYQLSQGIPFVDFLPYKTIFGYYLQLPALLLPGTYWDKLLYIKYEMALLNAIGLFLGCQWLVRRFHPLPILMALCSVICMSNFLERSIALRVDMITVWLGFASFIALIEKRLTWAGVLVSLSFLTSQKGAYFVLASGLSLGLEWLIQDRTKQRLIDLFRFCLSALTPLVCYLALFGLMSTVSFVSRETFVVSQSIALADLYSEVRQYWVQSYDRNQYFYWLSSVSLLLLVIRTTRQSWRSPSSILITSYLTIFISLCAWHKQPWPYFIIFIIPSALYALSEGLDHFYRILPRYLTVTLTLAILYGCCYLPLSSRYPIVHKRDSSQQKVTVNIAEQLLKTYPSSGYIAGVNILPHMLQPKKLSWLDRKQLTRIKHADVTPIIDQLKKDPPQFIIRNYRTQSLPKKIVSHIRWFYYWSYANIEMYCPMIPKGTRIMTPAFNGHYRLKLFADKQIKEVLIDGQKVQARTLVELKKAPIKIQTKSTFRLCLEPKALRPKLDTRYARLRPFFPSPYGY